MVIRREASAREIRRKRLIPRTVRESALSAKRCFKSQNGTGPSHKAPARLESSSLSLLSAPGKWGKKKEKNSCLTYSVTIIGLVGADPEQRQAKGSGSKFTVLSVDFQPTIQPTICDVLCDLQVFWQSPRSCKFYKGRSQEKTHLPRLEFFLLLRPLDRARFVLTYRTMCSVAGQCAPAVWVFTTSGFHRLFATKPVSCKTSPRYSDKGEVGGSSPPRPTICFSRLPGVVPQISTHRPTRTYHDLHRRPDNLTSARAGRLGSAWRRCQRQVQGARSW